MGSGPWTTFSKASSHSSLLLQISDISFWSKSVFTTSRLWEGVLLFLVQRIARQCMWIYVKSCKKSKHICCKTGLGWDCIGFGFDVRCWCLNVLLVFSPEKAMFVAWDWKPYTGLTSRLLLYYQPSNPIQSVAMSRNVIQSNTNVRSNAMQCNVA